MNHTTIRKTLILASACFGLSALSAPVLAHTQAVQCKALLDVPGSAPRGASTIVIKRGKISEILDGFVAVEDATIIDLQDKFCLPGLIDSHVHLTSELSAKGRLDAVTKSDADWAMNAVLFSRRTLMAGFTSVQDVGARGDDAIYAVRDAINRGEIAGPRIRAAGKTVSVSGGHGDGRHGYSEAIAAALRSPAICDGPDDCRRAVRENIRHGADVIKITATGGVLSNTAAGTEQQFFDDEMQNIVQAAHMMGRQVTAHAHGKNGIEAALRAGIDSIEHGTYLDKQTIALFKKKGAYLIPTVLAGATVVEMANDPDGFLPPPSRAKAKQVGPQMLDMLRLAHDGGVKIAFGTDSGVSKHGDNAKEFALMVQAGFTPMQAIKSATIIASEHLQTSDMVGSIEAGKFADIIAVSDSPLDNVEALLEVNFVMKGGRVYKNK
ncbi:Xaa-Pro dipeptidase family enzyme [hydrothermal vent metagenome]|uniref:Xaa-Pro dipeptidase family enzyme n=1 Tax=hydrothermal vent metagenome TaxID=652676 RepID=A0A3B0QZT3_9ZZZZ